MPQPSPPPSPERRRIAFPNVIVAIAAIAVFLYLIRSILLVFVLPGIVAYVCTPLVDRLTARTRLPRWVIALGLLLILMMFAALIGYLGVPSLMHEVGRVAGDLHGAVQKLTSRLMQGGSLDLFGHHLTPKLVADAVAGAAQGWFTQQNNVLGVVNLGIASFFGFILAWVLLGYFLIDAPRLAASIIWLVPPRKRAAFRRVFETVDPVLRRYFVGVVIVVAYASAVAYIGLGLVLHLRHAFVLALLTGLLEMIPVIGPAASAVLAGLVAVQQAQSAWNIVAYMVYAAALRISIDQFVGPLVLGRAAYIRPVLVIFCFLVGGLLYGIVGVVLAVPIALTVKVVLQQLYARDEEGSREGDI